MPCTLLRHCTCTFTWYVVSGLRTRSLVLVLLLWVSRVFQGLSPTTLASRQREVAQRRGGYTSMREQSPSLHSAELLSTRRSQGAAAGRTRSLPTGGPT